MEAVAYGRKKVPVATKWDNKTTKIGKVQFSDRPNGLRLSLAVQALQ
jgi:hypothetical protein